MEINEMISDLVKDLRPVRPVWPIGFRMAAWVGVAVAAAIGLLMAVSVRRDLDLVRRYCEDNGHPR